MLCAPQRALSYAGFVVWTGSRTMKNDQDVLALDDARKVLSRLRQGEPFRDHVEERLRLVLPASAVFALVALACAAATAVFFADLSSWLALPGFLLAPAVLVGSLYVQGLVFFLWLESRALAFALGQAPRRGMGELPRVPWRLAAAVLFVPLLLLLRVWPVLAIVLIAAAVLVPLLYVRLDRAPRKSRLTRSRAAV
jgi:hypothetical protein